jgi:demethoxyubiquinone hydroxylase (CLK1/Coq7/Cat5 family)
MAFVATKGETMEQDISIIRPQMRIEDVKWRGQGLSRQQKAEIRKRLRILHTLEIMAVTIYKCQIKTEHCEIDTALTAAMCNEMTHMQDFQTKLYEYGFKPSKLRFRYWMIGYVFGLGSRLMGRERTLKTGIWTEEKAVHHYGQLLNEIEWDDEVRAIIEKDLADEVGHVERWRYYLAHPDEICRPAGQAGEAPRAA